MPPVGPAMVCKRHEEDASITIYFECIMDSYIDSCLVHRMVVGRTINLYHEVAKEPCTLYPSCIFMFRMFQA